ncbi:hypothetical protein BH23CHL2_BH23CHL2_08110 [soil metagenome]
MAIDPRQEESPGPQIPTTFSDVIRRLEWRFELLAVAIILAEVFLVWLAFGLIMSEETTHAAYPFWVIAVVMLSAHFVTHLLDTARVWSPDYEIIMSVSIVLTLLISIKAASFPTFAIYDPGWLVEAVNGLAFFDAEQSRPVWGNVVLVVYAWFRGRSREEPSLDSAYVMFRWGTIALAIILVMTMVGAPEDLEILDLLSVGTIGFFGSTLAAIGVARMRLESFRATAPLGPQWLATFATPVAVILLVAIIAAGIFSRRFLATMLWVLSPLLFILSVVFQIIVLAIAIIAFLVLTPIFWLLGDLETEVTNATATPAGEQGETGLEQMAPETFTVPEPLQYLVAAIVLVAIITILTRYLFRRRSRKRPETLEERESVMDWSEFWGSFGGRLRSLFDREEEQDPYADLRGDDRWQYTLRVRDRYRDLQKRGEELGRARHSRETAEDYRPAIAGRFEHRVRPTVDGMTMIYRRARYSGIPATEADAEEMDSCWEELRSAASEEPAD